MEIHFAEDISELFTTSEPLCTCKIVPLKDESNAFPAENCRILGAENGSATDRIISFNTEPTYTTAVGFFLNLELLSKGKFHIENFPLRRRVNKKKKKKLLHMQTMQFFLIFPRYQTGFPTRNKELTS